MLTIVVHAMLLLLAYIADCQLVIRNGTWSMHNMQLFYAIWLVLLTSQSCPDGSGCCLVTAA